MDAARRLLPWVLLAAAGCSSPLKTDSPVTGAKKDEARGSITDQPAAPPVEVIETNPAAFQAAVEAAQGKVVLVDFWGVWCEPCKAAFPHTVELAEHFSEQGLVVMSVCLPIDPSDESEQRQGREFLQQVGAKPVQKPHPPIWVAGGSKPALRRAARIGDAWHPARPTFEQVQTGRAMLRDYLDEVGRAPDSVETAVKTALVFQDGPPGAEDPPTQGRVSDIVDALARYRDAGASHMVLDFVPETLATALDTMERFAQEVRPAMDGK